MTKIVREAIEALQELPEERQETIARAILDCAADDDGAYHLTDEERREVRAGLAEIERGEIASDDEVRAVYERIGSEYCMGGKDSRRCDRREASCRENRPVARRGAVAAGRPRATL